MRKIYMISTKVFVPVKLDAETGTEKEYRRNSSEIKEHVEKFVAEKNSKETNDHIKWIVRESLFHY